jgi:Arm DNA-binding domain
MPKKIVNALTPTTVRSAKKPGLLADGGGLYLQITQSRRRTPHQQSWIFRYRVGTKLRLMGIGPVTTLSLADARARARGLRHARLDGRDPIDVCRASQRQAAKRAAIGVGKHHAALPYAKIGTFVAQLREIERPGHCGSAS